MGNNSWNTTQKPIASVLVTSVGAKPNSAEANWSLCHSRSQEIIFTETEISRRQKADCGSLRTDGEYVKTSTTLGQRSV